MQVRDDIDDDDDDCINHCSHLSRTRPLASATDDVVSESGSYLIVDRIINYFSIFHYKCIIPSYAYYNAITY